MIVLKDITKKYEEPGTDATVALAGVSFSIKSGEFVSIMGPSGSGKSTLLHILSFLDRPTSGSYSFFGKTMSELTDSELAKTRNEEMGFIFQSFNLLGSSSVYANVEMPLLYASEVPLHARKARVEKAVEAVGLSEKLHIQAGKLSGGQKQRVAIARALVNSPTVIFADEPTGNLDSKSGAAVMEILKNLHKAGHTVVLVTHETYTAHFADRLITVKDGRIESDGPIKKSKREDGNETFFK